MKEINMLDLATFLSALGCGLIAGFFFAFSAVVMKALGKLPPAQGIAAMQSINVVVINPWFLTPSPESSGTRRPWTDSLPIPMRSCPATT